MCKMTNITVYNEAMLGIYMDLCACHSNNIQGIIGLSETSLHMYATDTDIIIEMGHSICTFYGGSMFIS